MFEKTVWITGMPRSGTTWLSQILFSHPDVRLKFCPLFSYEFKNALDEKSTSNQWRNLLKQVYFTESDYLDQEYLRRQNLIPSFIYRNEAPSVLAIKSTRFHNLTRGLIEKCPEIIWVAIVRNPCASVYSWISNRFEFPTDADPKTEWRTGACRKNGPGEFWGFNDWKTVTSMFVDLEQAYPGRFKIITHESLLHSTRERINELFSWIGLNYPEQTDSFLRASHEVHVDHERSVYKPLLETQRWKTQLDPEIKTTIVREVAGTPLHVFLNFKSPNLPSSRNIHMHKQHISDLALFGGTPIFATARPIGQLAMPDEEEFFRRARSIYDSKRITNNGPLVRELEGKLARIHQVENCVAFANACLCIVVLLEILSDGRSGEVIMPAFTYAGLPHLAQWAGQMPCFCDIEHDTHTLDPTEVGKCINKNTTSIMAVHQVNSPCKIEDLEVIALKHNVPLFYDSVHGVHCTYKGRPIGGFGRAEVFSLHATKLLNGFEGGYITTNDRHLADVLRQKRNFGIVGEADIVTIGLNAKLNELHAAAAMACLKGQKEIIERNRCRLDAYHKEFQGIPGLSWIPYQDKEERMNYEFSLLNIGPDFPFERDYIVNMLRAENAMAQPYYSPPLHLSQHCPKSITPPLLPVTENLARTIIQMPVGELVSLEDIAIMGDFFRFIYNHAKNIRQRLMETETP